MIELTQMILDIEEENFFSIYIKLGWVEGKRIKVTPKNIC